MGRSAMSLGLDLPAGIGALCLQQRGLGRDRNGIIDVSRLKLQVDALRGVDEHVDSQTFRAFEACQFRDTE